MAEIDLTEAELMESIEELRSSQQRMSEEFTAKFEELDHKIVSQGESMRQRMAAFFEKVEQRLELVLSPTVPAAHKVFEERSHPKFLCRVETQGAEGVSEEKSSDLLDASGLIATNADFCNMLQAINSVREDVGGIGDSENTALKTFGNVIEPIQVSEFSSFEDGIQLVEKAEQSFPSKLEVVELAYQMSNEMTHPNDCLSTKIRGLDVHQLFVEGPVKLSLELIEENDDNNSVIQPIHEGKLSFATKINDLEIVCHMLDEMPAPFTVKHDNGIDGHEELVLPTIELRRMSGCDFFDSDGVKQDFDKMINDSIVELGVGKVLLFIFDPGGYSLFHMGCGRIEINRHQEDYCLETNMAAFLNIGVPWYLPNGLLMQALRHEKQVPASVLKAGYPPETCSGYALITLYAKYGILDLSLRVFKEVIQNDVASCNSMIPAYCLHGEGNEAVKCFKLMQQSGVTPDKAAFTALSVYRLEGSNANEHPNVHLAFSWGDLMLNDDVEVFVILRIIIVKRGCDTSKEATFGVLNQVKASHSFSDGRIVEKSDNTPVTVADFGVQALVSLKMNRLFPHIPLVAEEDSASLHSNNLVDAVVDVVSHKATYGDQLIKVDVLNAIDRGGKDGYYNEKICHSYLTLLQGCFWFLVNQLRLRPFFLRDMNWNCISYLPKQTLLQLVPIQKMVVPFDHVHKVDLNRGVEPAMITVGAMTGVILNVMKIEDCSLIIDVENFIWDPGWGVIFLMNTSLGTRMILRGRERG